MASINLTFDGNDGFPMRRSGPMSGRGLLGGGDEFERRLLPAPRTRQPEGQTLTHDDPGSEYDEYGTCKGCARYICVCPCRCPQCFDRVG